MSRTTIRIEQQGILDPRVMFCIAEPHDVPHADVFEVLDCNTNVPPFSELADQGRDQPGGQEHLVRNAGREIYRRLSQHPGAADALNRVDNAAPNASHPIYLEMTTEYAESLPFETLFLPNVSFVALDRRTPIVRVAKAHRDRPALIERPCRVPLRVVAVIAAAERDVHEEAEWQALYDAFRESALDFRIKVFVGRDSLRQTIEANQDPRVEVHIIDFDEKGLMRRISDFEPAVLHFFCHGRTKPEAYLEIAGQDTCDMGDEPLYISHKEFSGIAETLWLVVLNACEGAARVQDAYSLALDIVNKGVPAVIGMREPIDATDATLFTGSFYAEFAREVGRVLSGEGEAAPDWGGLMLTPRSCLCRNRGGPPAAAAGSHKEWTLPVLYIRPEKLRLLLQTGDDVEFGELQKLKQLRRSISSDTPQDILDRFDARLREFEAALPG